MTSTQITEMLNGVMPGKVFQHSIPEMFEESVHCIVWENTGYKTVRGDNGPVVKARRFVVNLITQTDDDPTLWKLLRTLARNHVAFSDPETVYDHELAVLQHAVACEVPFHG